MPIPTSTLAIADGQTGSTATATITGSDAGATNTVFSQRVEVLGSDTWVSRGSRTGNGTVAVTGMTTGYYFWKTESVLGGEKTVSNIPYQEITDGLESVHKRILDTVHARILTLALTDISSDVVYKRWLPTDYQLVKDGGKDKFPCIMVCPAGTETDEGSLNVTDDIGFPVLVGLVDNANQNVAANMNLYLLYRQKLLSAFRIKRISNLVNVTRVEHLPVIDQEMFRNENLFVSGFRLRCVVRQSRA